MNRIYVTNNYNLVTVFQEVTTTTKSTPATAVPPGTPQVDTPQVSITFSEITSGGQTTIHQVDPSQLMAQLPGQFSISGALAYEISTTASVIFPATLCFNASSVTDPATFATLVVLHGVNGAWVPLEPPDYPPSSRDFATGTICASVNSLSPFVIARRVGPADTVAPVTTAVSSATADWSPGDVTITLTAVDEPGGSGVKQISYAFSGVQSGGGIIAGASASVVVSAEGQTDVTFYATDNAGNAGTPRGVIARIDRTPPVIAISAPTQATYTLRQMVTAAYGCTDAGAGVDTCAAATANGAPLDTTGVGAKTLTVQARDRAGNVSTASVSYTIAYGVAVLYDQTKAARSGSTVPIKVRLVDAAGRDVSSWAVTVQATAVTMVSSTVSAALLASGNANPDDNFRYDPALGGYIFNLKTSGLSTDTYNLSFTAGGDPTLHAVQFQVR